MNRKHYSTEEDSVNQYNRSKNKDSKKSQLRDARRNKQQKRDTYSQNKQRA